MITADVAADWRTSMIASNLSDASTRHYCRNAKAIFNHAVERELIRSNPFRRLTSTAVAATRERYVTPTEADAIMEACPDVHWRTLIGLGRLAGLRTPSETHRLTWADVDFDRSRLSVYSPKTERYEQHKRRTVPITPKLMALATARIRCG